MPILDFPDSPTLDEIFTSGLQSWIWDGITWNIVPTVSGGGEASIAVGPTAPVGPDDGDLWWDTDEPSLLNALVDPAALVADATFQTELAASSVYNAVLNGRYAPVVLGVHSLITAFATTGTHTTTQDEGLTLTLTPPGGRRWKFTLIVNPYTPGGTNVVRYRLMAGAVLLRQWDIPSVMMTTVGAVPLVLIHTEILGALGSTVFKLQVAAVTNNTAINSFATTSVPRQLIIEDIGII